MECNAKSRQKQQTPKTNKSSLNQTGKLNYKGKDTFREIRTKLI